MASTVPDTELDRLLEKLGVGVGPATRQNVRTCLEFFDGYCPGLSGEKRLSYMKAIDLHSPVIIERLGSGTKVVAWRPLGGPLHGLFYTVRGESIDRMGIPTEGRHHQSFTLRYSVRALSCRTSAFRHISLGSGGGRQFIIPRAPMVLKARGHE